MDLPSSARSLFTVSKCSGSPSTRTPSISKMTAAKRDRLALQCGRAAHDIEQFLGDLLLARLVVGEREFASDVVRAVRGVLHRHHLRGLEARRVLQHGLVDLHLDVPR